MRESDTDEHFLDDLLFEQDSDGHNTHSYPVTPFLFEAGDMPSPPINIATPRLGSKSPQSNLTAQLQQPQNTNGINMEPQHGIDPSRGRQESLSNYLSSTPFGARNIPVKEGARRESNALAGSLMGGMSWGGISMGSFIRDE